MPLTTLTASGVGEALEAVLGRPGVLAMVMRFGRRGRRVSRSGLCRRSAMIVRRRAGAFEGLCLQDERDGCKSLQGGKDQAGKQAGEPPR